jgi:hypothetical protein
VTVLCPAAEPLPPARIRTPAGLAWPDAVVVIVIVVAVTTLAATERPLPAALCLLAHAAATVVWHRGRRIGR